MFLTIQLALHYSSQSVALASSVSVESLVAPNPAPDCRSVCATAWPPCSCNVCRLMHELQRPRSLARLVLDRILDFISLHPSHSVSCQIFSAPFNLANIKRSKHSISLQFIPLTASSCSIYQLMHATALGSLRTKTDT